MKIFNSGITPLSRKQVDSLSQADKKPIRQADGKSAAAARDKAELSSEAQMMARAMGTLSETSDVRQEVVDAISEKINNGEYKIPYEDLAKKLIQKLGL